MTDRTPPNTTKSAAYIDSSGVDVVKKSSAAHICGDTEKRRTPRQERARLTVEAILLAAAELICDLGYDRASTNRIAERAGVSIGSLYQYFPNKEAILNRLMEEHHQAVHAVVDRALPALADPSVPLDDGLRGLFDALVDLHRADPVLTRALSSEVPHLHPHGHDMEDDPYVAHLEGLLRSRPDVRMRDPRTSAWVVVRTTEALTRGMVHELPPELDIDFVVEAAVSMLAGFLRAS